MSDNEYDRPFLVTLIAILYGLAGILMLLGGIALLVAGGGTVTEESIGMLGTVGGGVMVIAGLIYMVLCFGFLKGWSIMWYLGVIFAAFGILMGIVSIFTSGLAGIISVLIPAIIMWYLFRSNVKLFFLKHE